MSKSKEEKLIPGDERDAWLLRYEGLQDFVTRGRALPRKLAANREPPMMGNPGLRRPTMVDVKFEALVSEQRVVVVSSDGSTERRVRETSLRGQ